ncbi:MAG: glycosyltransferase [Rhodobiaceae bacterium]|nr:glycosyltransferase [Rhodobiaceae bacterium]
MAPFIDASDFADAGQPHSPDNDPIRFVTVAMMRARAKLDSYRLIADALSLCDDFDWALEIAGDGPERSSVEALFAPFGARVTFAGELDRQGVVDAYARSDALLWPGFNEAYGLVYLEAQAAGLPVAALDRGPQHAVIRAGETGLLTAEDPQAFAQALRILANDPQQRLSMGQAARRFVHGERTIAVAARRFNQAFDTIEASKPVSMQPAGFPLSRAVLDQVAETGRTMSVWLRDDDAVTPTHQLDRLLETVCGRGMALTLAVIPQYATPTLACSLERAPQASVATHGLAHINHSPAGTKSSEFGATREQGDVEQDLRAGLDRMRGLFGHGALPLFVPPWNRMAEVFHALLADCGYRAISTFGAAGEAAQAGLAPVSTHLDIMDWKARTGRAADDLDVEFAQLLKQRLEIGNAAPLGILTHHLVHDETAWSALDGLMALLSAHPAVEWLDMRGYLAEKSQ